jgi:hypothetical protein
VAIGLALPFVTPVASVLGFALPPSAFFFILPPMVALYLVTVEVVKRWFFRRYAM